MTTQRTCRYGHGDLKEEAGPWGMEGVVFKNSAIPPTGAMIGAMIGPMANDKVYVVQLWVCSTCGYVEMSDYKAPEQ